MKKYTSVIFILIAVICMICISACKKDNSASSNNPSGSGQSFTPTYIAPTQPGHIMLSVNALTLHPGESANISAALFQSDGSVAPVQPSFIWSVDQTSVATVSTGIVTASAIGDAELTVTDGNHGEAYVSIHVVPSSQTVSTRAASISFHAPTIMVGTGQTISFSYQLYDRASHTTSGAVSSFIYDPSSGISVSGTNITGGSVAGVYTVKAISGTDTLGGAMTVIVTAGSASPNTTTYAITDVYYPAVWGSKGLTARPVRITVIETKTNASGFIDSIKEYQTSPDQITIPNPEIIGSNGGVLTSLYPGMSKLQVTYKNVTVAGWSIVEFGLKGNWNNKDVCFSIDNPDLTRIAYWHAGVYNFNFYTTTISYHFTCDNHAAETSVVGQVGSSLLGDYTPMAGTYIPAYWDAATGKIQEDFFLGSFAITTCPAPISFFELTFAGGDQIKITPSGGGILKYIMNRQSSACVITIPPPVESKYKSIVPFAWSPYYIGPDGLGCGTRTAHMENILVYADLNSGTNGSSITINCTDVSVTSVTTGILCHAAPDTSTRLGVAYISETSGIWTGLEDTTGWGYQRGWSFTNGVVSSDKMHMTGTLNYDPHNSQPILTKQITMDAY